MGAKAVLDLINLWIELPPDFPFDELWLPWGESVCFANWVPHP